MTHISFLCDQSTRTVWKQIISFIDVETFEVASKQSTSWNCHLLYATIFISVIDFIMAGSFKLQLLSLSASITSYFIT